MAITGLNDRSKMSAYKALVSEQDKEIAKLKAEIERKDNALRKAKGFIINGVELGYISMPDPPDTALHTLPTIQKALQSEME